MMAYRPPRELRGRIENIRKKFEGETEISVPPAYRPSGSVKPLGNPDLSAKKQPKNVGKEAVSKLHTKDVSSLEGVAPLQGAGKNKLKWDQSNAPTKSHIRRTPAFRCDKNIVVRDYSGASGKVDNALFTTKVKIFEAEQKENVNTNKSKEISVNARNTSFNPARNTFRSKANAVNCVIKTIQELENKKNGDTLVSTAKDNSPMTQSSPHAVRNQQRDQKSVIVSAAELKNHDRKDLDDCIKQQNVNTHSPKPKPKSFDVQLNSNLQVISNTKNVVKPLLCQYEHEEPTKNVSDIVKESYCKNLEENTVNNRCLKGAVQKRNSSELSNSCALELTDSLRVALKSPLPQGPPPKKPPRTFAHSPATKSKVQERVSQFSATKEINNVPRQVPTKPQRSRTEPLLMLKKLEDALITHQQKGIAVITPRVPSASSTDQDRLTSGSHAAVVQSPPVEAETSSVLSNCLSSLNCATNTNLLYCQTHFYEKPAERLSKFFVDVATNRRKLDGEHGLYGTIQKSYSEEHIYAEPFSCSEEQTRNVQPVQILKCATLGRKQVKQVKTLSASAEHLNATDSPASHETLHYMCTPIATDVPPPAVFEAINKDLLSQTINSGAGSLSKRNCALIQERNTEELVFKADDTEKDSVTGKGETGSFGRKQPRLRLATIVRNTASPTPTSINNIQRPPDRVKIQLVMNQAFGSPLQGVPTTPVEDDDDDGDLFEKEMPSLGTVSSSSPDNHDEKGEHRLKIPPEDPEETPLPTTDLSRLTEERKVYVRRVSSHVSQLTRRAVNRSRDSRYTHLFECALLIGLNLDCEKRVKVPYIKSKYPPQVEVPPMLEHLCFPDALEWPPAPASQNEDQMYSLVITAEDGSRTFGYCRRVMPEEAPICLPLAYCLLSSHRARGFYSKVLQELESHHGQPEWLQTAFIKELFTCEFPSPGQGLRCHSTGKATDTGLVNAVAGNFRRPADTRMEDHDLSHLFSALPIHIVLQVFGTALLERKVIFLSNSLSKLSACIEAVEAMLYPFSWQYTFITILPSSKLEVCEAPTPYIIGVLKGKEGSKPDIKVDEGVIVDLDEGRLCCSVGDESTILPTRLRRCLKVALQLVTAQESDASRNVLISEAFLRMFVEVCGHYQTYIVTQQDGRRMFERESFIKAVQSRSVQMFLEWFTETAMFSEFITTRVEQQSEAKGMFEQRVAEHIEEMEKNTVLFLRNYKGINKKVKTFGDRLKDWAPFS